MIKIEEKRERILDTINPFGSREPKWDVPVEDEFLKLGFAYSWYNYNASPSQHKKWVMDYCNKHVSEINQEALDSVNEKRFIPYGPTVRIFMLGGPIKQTSLEKLNTKLKNLEKEHILLFEEKIKINKIKSFLKEEKEKEYNSTLIYAINDEIQNFINSEQTKLKFDYKQWIDTNNVPKKVHLNIIKEWNSVKEQILSNDPVYIEAYSHISSDKKMSLIEFIQDMNSINTSSVPETTVIKQRVKKPKSPQKQVKKLKFMQSFDELNIKSIKPEKIIDTTNLLVYNTQYKILYNYIAEKNKTFEVKGTTLLNFDENSSVGKRLRKPEEVLTIITSSGKMVFKKTFESLKTKPIKPTGRINEHCILLKAF